MRSSHHQSRQMVRRVGVFSIFALAFSGTGAFAQLFDRPTVIRGARIISMNGPVLEKGDILLRGGRISEIGPEVQLSFGELLTARTIEAQGMTITPGFIDAWSALGRHGVAIQPDATANAWDAFDPFDSDAINAALRQGVTTVYVGPGGSPGIVGTSSVIRLARTDAGVGERSKEEAAFCINLGSGQPTVARMKTFQEVRKKFQTALEYRQSLEDYEADLKEYMEKIEKRKNKKESEAAGKDDSSKDEKADEDSPENESDKPKPEEEEKDDQGRTASGLGSDQPTPKADPPADEKDKKDDKDEMKEEEELTKPKKPAYDATSERLLQLIDHELPARIEAHRSSDILNALNLADEFNLDLILEGATEAYLVADRIADADVRVVLGQMARTELFEANEYRRHSVANAAALSRAGITWTVGSGGENPTRSAFVAMNAQLAAAKDSRISDRGPYGWMSLITTDAARILGVRAGRLAKGMPADLVLWDGDPSDPTATVDRVFVGGEVVLDASGGGS